MLSYRRDTALHGAE